MDGDALADIEDFCKFLQKARGAIPGTAEGLSPSQDNSYCP